MGKNLLFSIVAFLTFVLPSVSQWQSVGPAGGEVQCIYTNGTNVFVISGGSSSDNIGVLFRSTNGGLDYSVVSPLSSHKMGYNIDGIGANIICHIKDEGIYKSSDNGDNWIVSNTGLPSVDIRCIGSNSGNFYIGTNLGFFKSTNFGQTWITLNDSVRISRLTFSNSDIFASGNYGIESGMFISTNGGLNWSTINNNLPQSGSIRTLALHNSAIFCGIDITGSGTIYKSTNSGQNWVLSNNGLGSSPINCLKSTGSILYAATSGGIFRSSDNGSIWTPINVGLESNNCKLITSNGSVLFAGLRYNGIYTSSNNGDLWYSTNTNFNALSVWGNCSMVLKGSVLFACIEGTGIWKSQNNGDTWTKVNTGLPLKSDNSVAIGRSIATDGQNLFAVANSSVYKSTNDGASWFLSNNGMITNSTLQCIFVNSGKIYIGTNSGIYTSSNSGINWSYLGLSNRTVNTIEFENSTSLFAVGSDSVQHSSDGGMNWENITSNLVSPKFIKILGQSTFVTTRQGMYSRNISGGNWILCSNGITNLDLYHVFILNQYLVTVNRNDNGVYVSYDQGQNWNNVNQGLPRILPNLLLNAGNYVFLGTGNASIYRRPFAEIIGIQTISTEIPKHFSLSQNYPNPFNPTTQIEFSIPENNEFVKLTVFDVTGKEIATLVNQQLNAGTYKVDFNGENIASGLYFYKLVAGDFVGTKKMILIK